MYKDNDKRVPVNGPETDDKQANLFTKSNVKDIYSLSPMQEGILFHHILDETSTASFLQTVLFLEGELDLVVLEKSFNKLIERYDILRTFFTYQKTKRPRQIVLKQWELSILFEDISAKADGDKDIFIEDFKREDRRRGFKLVKEIPMRVAVIKTSARHYCLVWSSHHILMDGWCTGILFTDLTRIYQEMAGGVPAGLDSPFPYSNYIKWLEMQDKEKGLDYWRHYLEGVDVRTSLPKLGKVDDKAYNLEEYPLVISPRMTRRLKKISTDNQVTINIIFQACWGILLQRYNNTDDVVFGSIVSGRTSEIEGIESMIGLFINAVPVRIHTQSGETFSQVLRRLQQEAGKAKSFEYIPLAEIQSLTPAKNQLVDHIMVLENYPHPDELNDTGSEGALGFKVAGLDHFVKTEYDLNLLISPGESVQVVFNFNSLLYPASFIKEVASQLERIIAQVTADPDIQVNTISILSDEDEKLLLETFNDTAGSYPEDKTVQQLFEEQAGRTPDHIAVVSALKNDKSYKTQRSYLTYKQLNQTAAQLSSQLRERGVTRESIVALMVEPSIEMIIGILGILKSGAAYLPISPGTPRNRVISMLNDSGAVLLLTEDSIIKGKGFSFISLRGIENGTASLTITAPRPQVEDLDALQVPDRSLVDYEKYSPYIGQAMVKNSITIHMSRGCVYNCAFCFKIWPKKYILRSAQNIFAEILSYYNMGFRRFAFVDDLPNFNMEVSSEVYRLIIDNGLDVHLHYPNGIRGDILTPQYIDLMVKAGTVTMDLALETTSPRLQKLVRKNLNLPRLYENIRYITENHPQVILELQILHGLPTETEEEARASLDFIKQLRWVHFPYIHILNIYPNSDMAKIAIQHGISPEAIRRSADLAYHELPETLPFEKSFTKNYQAEFLNEYFLSTERLLTVLPYQMKALTEDELVQKYNSYLPVNIHCFDDLLAYIGVTRDQLDAEFLPPDYGVVPHLNEKLKASFPAKAPAQDALRILFLDLSQFFTHETPIMYDVVEPPLGLMYLMTHLNRTFGDKIHGKIAKSRIDFDGYEQLKILLDDFKPHVIGIRTLNYYKDFFHKSVSLIKQWHGDALIVAGGPYATSSYSSMLADAAVDVAVLGEGEITMAELVGKIMENGKRLPDEDCLSGIPGLAFVPRAQRTLQTRHQREVLFFREMQARLESESVENPSPVNLSHDPAYVIYTSGSTGIPKGVVVQHNNLVNQLTGLEKRFHLDSSYNYLLLAAFTFDVSVMHIFSPLVTGARLFLVPDALKQDAPALWKFVRENNISILNMVPAFLKVLLENIGEEKPSLKYIFVGGDVFGKELYSRLQGAVEVEEVLNIYGPTETTINAALYSCGNEVETVGTIPIGKPLMNYRIYILDIHDRPVPVGAVGELCIAGAGVARGYLNRPELTAERFTINKSFSGVQGAPRGAGGLISMPSVGRDAGQLFPTVYPHIGTPSMGAKKPLAAGGSVYRTGDLARWLPDGNIEFLGRLDNQVKIRGFRIELGEIEDKLLGHPGIKEAVVALKNNNGGDPRLCAYIVPLNGGVPEDLKKYLLRQLPDYMTPTSFMELEQIPRTPGGKPNRKALPDPWIGDAGLAGIYAKPRFPLEEDLARIWADVLGLSQGSIGIDADFFDLGGHSLRATQLIARIHKELDVKLPMADLFKNSTIRKMAERVSSSAGDTHISIEKAVEKPYYPLSSQQARMYLLQVRNPESTAYNLPMMLRLEGELQRDRFEQAFFALIRRHDSLRTSFPEIDNQPVQKVHETVDFSIEYQNRSASEVFSGGDSSMFVRPFDLRQAPLLRAALVKTAENNHILIVDVHHIITDGTSNAILAAEFMSFYEGKQLPPLRIQYKDYSDWQNRQREAGVMKQKEAYWLGQFAGEIPRLHLPTDFERPARRSFAGDRVTFVLDREQASGLKTIATETSATLYMVLLSVFTLLLSRLSGQNDIVVGTPVAGRVHSDLQDLIGLFVNTLAMRNYPSEEKTFSDFLAEVRMRMLEAYENQDYPFEELVEHVDRYRDAGRNPLFDVMFVLQNIEMPVMEIPGLRMESCDQNDGTTVVDLGIQAAENNGEIQCTVNYSTALFKEETVVRFTRYFMEIVAAVLEDKHIPLKNINISHRLSALTSVKPDIDFGF